MKLNLSHPLSVSIDSQIPTGENPERSVDVEDLLPGYHRKRIDTLQNDRIIIPEHYSFSPTRRLVVLIPEGNFDESELSHKLWQLASTASLPILFLALSTDQEGAAYLHRRLVTMAAVTAFGEVKTTTRVIVGKGWLQAIPRVLRPGDLLICLSKHLVPFWLMGRRALGEYLSISLSTPIYLIGDLQINDTSYRSSRIREALSWLAFFATIVVFALIQTWIDQTTGEPTSTILLCLSVIIEFLLILKTNEWIG